MPTARTRRSPIRLTSRPLPSADTRRMKANAEITAPAAVRPTPNSRAYDGMAGATTPKPTATAKATAVRTPTSRGRPAKGWRRVLTGATLTGPADAGAARWAARVCAEWDGAEIAPIGRNLTKSRILCADRCHPLYWRHPEVSRSRRRARHRRPHRVTLVAAPLALGGAVRCRGARGLAARRRAGWRRWLQQRGPAAHPDRRRVPGRRDDPAGGRQHVHLAAGSTTGAAQATGPATRTAAGRTCLSRLVGRRGRTPRRPRVDQPPEQRPVHAVAARRRASRPVRAATSTATTVPTPPSILPSLPILTSTPVSLPTVPPAALRRRTPRRGSAGRGVRMTCGS